MVLLRNAGVLPLPAAAKVALFGNASYSMITGGTGSGDVNEAYTVSLPQGLKDAGLDDRRRARRGLRTLHPGGGGEAAAQPMPFMPKPRIAERVVPADEIARLAREADLALVTIGRDSGEFRDRKLEGDFELSATEKAMLAGRGHGLPRPEEEARSWS